MLKNIIRNKQIYSLQTLGNFNIQKLNFKKTFLFFNLASSLHCLVN